jgi:hypothetical protein
MLLGSAHAEAWTQIRAQGRFCPHASAWGLLAAAMLLFGCPSEPITDDDSAVDQPDDDDTTLSDEPDEVLLTGAADCGPIRSVMYKDFVPHGPTELAVIASTLKDVCGLYQAYWEGHNTSYEAHWFEYQDAVTALDGPTACAELLAWYEGYLPLWAAMYTPGSCTAAVNLEAREPATYDSEAEPGSGTATVSVQYPTTADAEAFLALFDGCTTVTDWATWMTLSAVIGEAQWWSGETWWDTAGTVTLDPRPDGTYVLDAMGMTVEETASAEPGTLTFHLTAEPCELAPPPGY